MIGISINKFKIKLSTASGDYGFKCEFNSGLNIIRGNNSSGKSTFINSFIYSLGMEELIGGKGVKVLPYALKEYVESSGKNKVKIASSYVYVELTNKCDITITLKRSIISDDKDSKLIEIIQGAYLSDSDRTYTVIPTFLHDAGSAQNNNTGFFTYLEKFIGLQLPQVAGVNTSEVKLYLQTIFSAILIEQKRGWTDYIANTPYYAIRDVRTKIVEFTLGLEVFENERKRLALLAKISQIQQQWKDEKFILKLASDSNSIIVSGIREKVDNNFDSNLVTLEKLSNNEKVQVHSYIATLVSKVESIENKATSVDQDASKELIDKYNLSKTELDKLIVSFDVSSSDIRVAKSRFQQYETTKKGIEEELKKNKIALKLKKFGADQNIEIAKDICPSCHQQVDDSLLLADTLVQPMSLDENIKYLDSQRKMISKYMNGLMQSIDELKIQSVSLSEEVSEKRSFCLSLKKDIRSSDAINESDIRLKVQFEMKIEKIVKTVENIDKSIGKLEEISAKYKIAKENLSSVPARKMSQADRNKIYAFQSSFRKLANTFGYRSAPTEDIEINFDTLFPYLSGIELREVNTDIKSDSSASDFVRLIWAYLLSIYIVSNKNSGNHLGLIVFDEPAQHSMGVSSINALLKILSSQQSALQSIVSASFDEDDQVFSGSVKNVKYNLISVGNKLLKKI